MLDTIGAILSSAGMAFLSSSLGHAELIVGLLVAMSLVVLAARGIDHGEDPAMLEDRRVRR
jgi:hypothetical protein